ncbi:unnamed protein product [Coffea canephora]|uniref:DH200=94 genomic scaffold, scaffold_2797 n=1 Tax=Coffea canephora TaxID=49390 RepID=A0A068VKW2_COFCA|nr:unnamed protein product [Coffea canephora]
MRTFSSILKDSFRDPFLVERIRYADPISRFKVPLHFIVIEEELGKCGLSTTPSPYYRDNVNPIPSVTTTLRQYLVKKLLLHNSCSTTDL